jgi:DNA helicase II / ATP-dependent DNA helicase PcrA
MNMPQISKVSGPPGTGKTSYLLRQLSNAFKKYEPEHIGAVSFSTASVEEIRNRVNKQIPGSLGKNIKTIHAQCFSLLGLNKDMVIDQGSSKIKEWNQAYPNWAMSSHNILSELEDDPSLEATGYSLTENRKRFSRINILRGTMVPQEKWPADCRAMHRDWSAWCREMGYWDYTSMLEEVYRRQLSPDISILFIDEAQDLSRLQLAITRAWAENCESAVWIGDPDQSIMRFTGAVPEDFRDLKCDWSHVLSQSYRVPISVHEYALKLIRRIGTRRTDIEYQPTGVWGTMVHHRHIYPDLSLPGSHMLLTRCNYHLPRWIKYLTRQGLVWHNPYRDEPAWNPATTHLWQAVRTYDDLSRGLDVTARDLLQMIGQITVDGNLEPGVKANRKKFLKDPYERFDVYRLLETGWFTTNFHEFNRPLDCFFKLTGGAGGLLRTHGKKIVRQEPRCIVGTIHSVKGGEADHVWIDTTSSPSISRAALKSLTAFDDEVRLAYVAVTRARQTCGLIAPVGLANIAFL